MKQTDLTQDQLDLAKIIAFIIEHDLDQLISHHDKHFVKDLGLDSLIALEIIAAIEKRYHIEIPEERLVEITSLDLVFKLVADLLNGATPVTQ